MLFSRPSSPLEPDGRSHLDVKCAVAAVDRLALVVNNSLGGAERGEGVGRERLVVVVHTDATTVAHSDN